ncbi:MULTISPECIES: 2,3-diaminopropionate biosynthesis protein SbnA [Amycolatopsis]|uniref:N-(2-amino-2-carboxyethyl)-L-glutamate synthase n=1 Tax=Amycolatopsis albidoflavus TaxID=102226 RepID=A0ABW5I6Z8_9PSEU
MSELQGILSTIGNTPLVRLRRLLPGLDAEVLAKLEFFNPGGSIKDRSALSMLADKIHAGELVPGRSTVVESSSGNLALGIAQVCGYFRLRFVCVVDARTTEQNRALLRAHNVEVEVIDRPDPTTGEYLPQRIRRVRELVESIPGAYWPNQYANPLNSRAHERTMGEIVRALAGRVDYLFCAVSSCGTLRGCADYVRRHGLRTRIIAVDAAGSQIFDGQQPRPRLLPGHGASVRPALFDPTAAHDVVHVTDLDCVLACHRLVAREAVLAGGSSGATVAALSAYADRIPAGSSCVLVFPDGGDRYLDTIYSDSWTRRHLGVTRDAARPLDTTGAKL